VLFEAEKQLLRDFGDSAKSLTRNPLGVIGLFLVLVYGMATMFLGLGGDQLHVDERLPMVWFLVIFPVLVLGVFYRLVSRHHKKLYAPGDYRDEQNFVNSQDPQDRAKRVDEEIAALEAQGAEPKAVVEQNAPSVSTEILPGTAVRNRYAEAERLGLLEAERRLGKGIRPYVSVESNRGSAVFDGLLLKPKEVHVVEVKYYPRPTFKREFLESDLHRAGSFLFTQMFDHGREKGVFWFIIVMDFPREAAASFADRMRSSVASDLFEVEFVFVHYEDLERELGTALK
jgi:hypothetical protein